MRKILRCSTTMLAPARLARLRGAMHRGGDQTLQCSATMPHLQDWHDSAVLGIVAVAKPCDAARRCVHLQDWHDSAVQGIVAAAKPCGTARRSMQLQDWHDCAVQGTVLVEILWRSAKMLALQDVHNLGVAFEGRPPCTWRRCAAVRTTVGAVSHAQCRGLRRARAAVVGPWRCGQCSMVVGCSIVAVAVRDAAAT